MEHQFGIEAGILDAVIVGGGLGGVIMLAEAVQQGYTRILLLERAESLGGLWARVPAWQTIQNHPLDFCLQGFTTRKSVWHARDVLHFIDEYARVQNLQPFIRCSHDVVGASWSDGEGCWVLEILIGAGSREVMRCRKLVLCTGRHATPVVPLVDTDGSVPMVHSSQFHRLEEARGKRVVVVGGGASALDLCVNVLRIQANDDPRGQLHWVVRSPRFFSGSEFLRLWPMTILQLLFGMTVSTFILNAAVNAHAMVTFGRRGLRSWLPPRRFDLRYDQYVPGRSSLLGNSRRIRRHAGVGIEAVRSRAVTLTDGTTIERVDLVLLGTGYARPAHPAGVGTLDGLSLKSCAADEHQGRLFLVGEELLDTTGAAPALYHVFGRVFWTLVRDERCLQQLPLLDRATSRLSGNLNNMDVVNRIVSLASGNRVLRPVIRSIFPFVTWRIRMCCVFIYYSWLYRTTVFFPDRVLGHMISLDGAVHRAPHQTGTGQRPRG
jgi:hypothetical protein